MTYKKALAAGSAALVVFTVLLILLLTTDNETPAPAVSVYQINSLNVADISAAGVNNGTGAYGFIIAPDGTISLVSKPEEQGADYSQEEMRAFIFILSKLTAPQAVEYQENPADFGLDQPLARVSLILKDKSTLRFLLGDQNPVNEGYYFQKEGENLVYLIGREAGDLMLRSRTDYWNRNLLPGMGTESADLLQSIRMTSAEFPSRNWLVEHRGEFLFQLAEPVLAPLGTDSVFSRLILPLSSFYPDTFAGLREQPGDFGLDKPDFVLSVALGDEFASLLFKRADGGGFYTANAAGRGVFAVSNEQAGFLELPYRELLGDYAYNGSLASVESVEFKGSSGGAPVRLLLFGEGTGLYGILDGVSLPYQQVSGAAEPLYRIGILEEVNRAESLKVSVNTPLAVVTIKNRNGTADTLEFFQKDESTSYLRLNGEIHFTTYTRSAEELEESLAAVKNGRDLEQDKP